MKNINDFILNHDNYYCLDNKLFLDNVYIADIKPVLKFCKDITLENQDYIKKIIYKKGFNLPKDIQGIYDLNSKKIKSILSQDLNVESINYNIINLDLFKNYYEDQIVFYGRKNKDRIYDITLNEEVLKNPFLNHSFLKKKKNTSKHWLHLGLATISLMFSSMGFSQDRIDKFESEVYENLNSQRESFQQGNEKGAKKALGRVISKAAYNTFKNDFKKYQEDAEKSMNRGISKLAEQIPGVSSSDSSSHKQSEATFQFSTNTKILKGKTEANLNSKYVDFVAKYNALRNNAQIKASKSMHIKSLGINLEASAGYESFAKRKYQEFNINYQQAYINTTRQDLNNIEETVVTFGINLDF